MEYFTKDEIRIINSNYSTAARLKDVLLNMLNQKKTEIDLFNLIFLADEKHTKLFYKILKMDLEYINSKNIKENFLKE